MQSNKNKTPENNMNKNIKNSRNKTNETGSISIQGHIKIFDPESKQVFVNKR
jgi:hypothetical protein